MNLGQLIDAGVAEKLRREALARPQVSLATLLERGLAVIREHECLFGRDGERESNLPGDTELIFDAFKAAAGPLTVLDLIMRLGLPHGRVMPHVSRFRKQGRLRAVDDGEKPLRYVLTGKPRR